MIVRKTAWLIAALLILAGNKCFAIEPIKVIGVKVSSYMSEHKPEKMIDRKLGNASRWVSEKEDEVWAVFTFNNEQDVGGLHLYSGYGQKDAITDAKVQYMNGGAWKEVLSGRVRSNKKPALSLVFDEGRRVKTKSIRVMIEKTPGDVARIKEIVFWPFMPEGIPPLGVGVEKIKPGKKSVAEANVPTIYLNQSGFNLGAPKRFTAPLMTDGISFVITERDDDKVLFSGSIKNHLGDFTDFNPEDWRKEYVVKANGVTSFPFRVGQWWLERTTYQNMVDFMIDSRHYVGTYKKTCRGSYGWRDNHQFGWELHTMVSQYLSNPGAYDRMPRQISYEKPDERKTWGALEPYDETAPDIVKLIHWASDVIVTRDLRHEHFKAQLAYFLYAWPWLKKWMPQQNYDSVKAFAFANWAQDDKAKNYPYDESRGHNLLAVKKKVGSTKGALPPGYTVMPNLLMYEVARREDRSDKDLYFQTAYDQVKWIIDNIDWNDPMTTKGQRMSEHLTMTGMVYMYTQYKDKAPVGLKKKIEAWCDVVLKRSGNMWDFRKYSDSQWVPTGVKRTMWNEPGNVLGFPACMLSAMQVVDSPEIHGRFNELIFAHFDNAFGRNPTGRHCVYHGIRDVEGVDLGWFSLHNGLGKLKDVRFVIEATAKNEHYPYHPEMGNSGWSEGWVNFNTAFNQSMAYLAYRDISLTANKVKRKTYDVRLKVPLNFDYEKRESVDVIFHYKDGSQSTQTLKEENINSAYFVGTVKSKKSVKSVSYGYGFFEHRVNF
ncbi:hypothetical protein FUAX_25530 [Fulvitalea axinellae]|uniref:F5/8 type C domain-containing protein n=1 Tax=Fulvitalea axinellae TaxID=1182444 RepID=A0AAU9DAV9_9BACT|nr:hypothetical protein FUAX_25530 [Fulvitalea axinellae]